MFSHLVLMFFFLLFAYEGLTPFFFFSIRSELFIKKKSEVFAKNKKRTEKKIQARMKSKDQSGFLYCF
jgi:hypothetical protein